MNKEDYGMCCSKEWQTGVPGSMKNWRHGKGIKKK